MLTPAGMQPSTLQDCRGWEVGGGGGHGSRGEGGMWVWGMGGTKQKPSDGQLEAQTVGVMSHWIEARRGEMQDRGAEDTSFRNADRECWMHAEPTADGDDGQPCTRRGWNCLPHAMLPPPYLSCWMAAGVLQGMPCPSSPATQHHPQQQQQGLCR